MFKGFAIPIVQGRGAGLGNELLVWGKAYIAAQALGLKPLNPAFGMNARGYADYFDTPRSDWLQHRLLQRLLPSDVFTEADYRSRQQMSFANAVQHFAVERGLDRKWPLAFGVEGMWGGYSLIEPAREYLLGRLLGSRWTVDNLYALDQRIAGGSLTIGFHIRRGDFGSALPLDAYQGRFNVAVPLEWYANIARNLRSHFGDRVNFVVVSDAPRSDLAPFGTDIPTIFTDDRDHRDVSDLLALSRCNLIVCSISSYSLWATFFSEGRYIWPAANLTSVDGLASIWGHEAAQQSADGATARAAQAVRQDILGGRNPVGRGVAVGWEGELPDELLTNLDLRLKLGRSESDLMRYGVICSSQSNQIDSPIYR